jgi:hypothetical protein
MKKKNTPTHRPQSLKAGDIAEGIIAQTIASVHLSLVSLGDVPENHKRLDWTKATYHIAGAELSECLGLLDNYSPKALRPKHYRVRELMRETLDELKAIDLDSIKSIRNSKLIGMVQTLGGFTESAHLTMLGAGNSDGLLIEAEATEKKEGSNPEGADLNL